MGDPLPLAKPGLLATFENLECWGLGFRASAFFLSAEGFGFRAYGLGEEPFKRVYLAEES